MRGWSLFVALAYPLRALRERTSFAKRTTRDPKPQRNIMSKPLDIVIFGLSITSSWGNGHATTFRALVRALSARGHNICFLERDMPWYAEHRDLPNPPYGLTQLYKSVAELKKKFARRVMNADLCIVGSYVPDGIAIGEWVIRTCRGVKAFYDIDTPVTLAKLATGDAEYVTASLVRR